MTNLPPGMAFTPFAAPFSFDSKPEARTIDGTHRFQHWAMACSWGLWIANQEFEYSTQVALEVWNEVDRLENLLSRFHISSDVYRINAAGQRGDTDWISISMDAWECLLLGSAMGSATAGAFDLCLAQTIEERRDENDLISDATPQSWSGPNFSSLELEEDPPRARLNHREAQIDLGAIGKGFALDKTAQLLGDWNIADALIYAGQSTVLAWGNPPFASDVRSSASACPMSGWPLELRDPQIRDEGAENTGRVFLENAALSGSGQALHGYHIIDPRTGHAAPQQRATWAIAPTAALSDACSTAFMTMSATEIEEFCLQHPGVSALGWNSGAWQSFGNARWQLPQSTTQTQSVTD